ncbi:uncharacterized protein BXZ73DRAFT_52286 [Epithele typhae]|uniref:uncharacterized protein n=1 Tax=Epithele typhae TaxID=378194 RepID=UPI002007FC27|nr:uncharacterized protein BXZ73DRAFT_52286 [Epithele typhae]KAH9920207.1 hypothetical protein BXZ73DRAFT_52286 [Epithele typhae]
MSDWTVNIDDSSSVINYSPYGMDGGLGVHFSTGWQAWYSAFPGGAPQHGQSPAGQSEHITALPGASFDFKFYGTTVVLYGSANCSYTVAVDGDSRSLDPSQGPELFHSGTMSQQTHTVTVTVGDASSSSMFAFDGANITRSHLDQDGPDGPETTVIQNTNTTFLNYVGPWTLENTDGTINIPSIAHPAPYHKVVNGTPSMSFSFRGTGLAINGTRNDGAWKFAVSVDGTSSTFNSSTEWFIPDALLYYQDGLDAQQVHNVTLTPVVGNGFQFWLNTVTLFNVQNASSTNPSNTSSPGSNPGGPDNSGSDTSKSHTGTIVGAVVGSVAGLALVAALLFFWLRGHRARTERAQKGHWMTPFPATTSSPPPPAMSAAPDGAPSTPLTATTARVPYTGGRPSKLAAEQAYAANPRPSAATAPGTSPASPGAPSASGSQPSGSAYSASGSQHSSQGAQSEPSTAAVERLVEVIINRIERTEQNRSLGSDVHPDFPPPEYSA